MDRNMILSLPVIIDGKLLEFMHVTDICTIFGNAIDNAIENVVMIKVLKKELYT